MIQLRTADSHDLASIRRIIPVVLEAALPQRPRLNSLLRSAERLLRDTLVRPGSEAEVILAEDGRGNPVGFIHLQVRPGGRSGELPAAVADLAVPHDPGCPGVARALLTFAEGWTRLKGIEALTLTLLGTDPTVRTLYATLGYPD